MERLRLGTGWDIVIEGDRRDALSGETGGHRFQRVPPTERRGRVHTSSVTVSVTTDEARDGPWRLRSPEHFAIEWRSGTGKGGQHRNKTQSCCRIIHVPTGISEYREGRNRVDNERDARRAVQQRLDAMAAESDGAAASAERRGQAGSGQRGDKVRTIRFRDDVATDHRTGKMIRASDYMAGRMDRLW